MCSRLCTVGRAQLLRAGVPCVRATPSSPHAHLAQHLGRRLFGQAALHNRVVELQRCWVEAFHQPGVVEMSWGRGSQARMNRPPGRRGLAPPEQTQCQGCTQDRRRCLRSPDPEPQVPSARTCIVGRSAGSSTSMLLMRSRTPSLQAAQGCGGLPCRRARQHAAGRWLLRCLALKGGSTGHQACVPQHAPRLACAQRHMRPWPTTRRGPAGRAWRACCRARPASIPQVWAVLSSTRVPAMHGPPTSAACQAGTSSRRAGCAAACRAASGWSSARRPPAACGQHVGRGAPGALAAARWLHAGGRRQGAGRPSPGAARRSADCWGAAAT